MAFAYIRQQDYVSARNALMQAVRWDPMNCNYRLDLAELFRALEDKQEWASLSFSVLERASDGKCAARAYTNLGQYFLEPETENISAAVGCARLALRLAPNDAHTTRLLNKIHTTYPDAADESDDHVMGELALQGVPTSPSAEIAICLIMCATDAASDGDKQEATRLTVRARDLVGEEACAAIIKLVRESDAELNAERKAKREVRLKRRWRQGGRRCPVSASASSFPRIARLITSTLSMGRLSAVLSWAVPRSSRFASARARLPIPLH